MNTSKFAVGSTLAMRPGEIEWADRFIGTSLVNAKGDRVLVTSWSDGSEGLGVWLHTDGNYSEFRGWPRYRKVAPEDPEYPRLRAIHDARQWACDAYDHNDQMGCPNHTCFKFPPLTPKARDIIAEGLFSSNDLIAQMARQIIIRQDKTAKNIREPQHCPYCFEGCSRCRE